MQQYWKWAAFVAVALGFFVVVAYIANSYIQQQGATARVQIEMDANVRMLEATGGKPVQVSTDNRRSERIELNIPDAGEALAGIGTGIGAMLSGGSVSLGGRRNGASATSPQPEATAVTKTDDHYANGR